MTILSPDPSTNTYSFLFTDIEGSTRLWKQQPKEMLFDSSRVFESQRRFWVKEAIGRLSALPLVEGEDLLRRERMQAKGWLTAGRLAFNWGEMPAARAAFSESIALARNLDDPFTLALSLAMSGLTWQFANDLTAARADAEESIALFLDSTDKWHAAMGMMVLSWVEGRRGNQAGRDQLLNEVHRLAEGTTHPMMHYLLMGHPWKHACAATLLLRARCWKSPCD